MEPTGLTSLPVEVIHHISRYLSVQDVLSCSLTCYYLRDALNDNVVWRKYLRSDLSRLETQEQLLSPALNIDASLTPLCENRKQFVRKTHLMNNWRQGHCVQYRNTSKCWFRSGVFNKTKGKGNVIYDDKYIFLGRFTNDVESDGIEVWDITKIPVCHTVLKIEDLNYECFFIVGSYLVVVECIKVFVYHINLPEKDLPLMFSFLITEGNVTFNERVEHSGRHDFRCVGWYHATVNNYLISSKCGENVLLHVWDIDKASKIGCFEPPVECFSIVFHSYTGKNLFFKVTVQASSVNYLSVFDIEKLHFTDHSFSYSSSSYILLFEENVLLFKSAVDANPEGWHDTVCSVFEFNSSLKLKERRFDNASKNYMLDSIAIVNGKFVILCNDGFHIVDAVNLETVDVIKVDNVSFITKQIVLFQSYVVIACTYKDKLELWDVNRKSKLPVSLNEVYTTHLYWDRVFTKLVMINFDYVKVIHFW